MEINKGKRFREIASVLIKNGFKEGSTNPQKMKDTLEELGPTFVKIGQILSTRPDILPENYIVELRKLQDDVKPEEFPVIKQIVEKELNSPIHQIFKDFEEKPLASASIAQVHKAVLKNDKLVVVKVKRPHIEEIMLTDLAILNKLTKIISFFPQSIFNPGEIIAELYQGVKRELDFIEEGKNIDKFYQLNKDVPFLRVPKTYPRYNTNNLLIMEYIEGIKISDKFTLLEKGYDLKEVSIKLANNFLKQVFQDGFFHGDPHPGNILISGEKIAYLDFGLMGSLSPNLKFRLNELLTSIVFGDIKKMARVILQIGIKRNKVERKKLHSDLEEMYNQYATLSIEELDIPELIDQIFNLCKNHKITIPKDIILMAKSFILMEGNVALLTPDLNLMDIATPYVKRQMLEGKNLQEEAIKFLENLIRATNSTIKLPEKVLILVNKLLAGNTVVQMEHINLDKNINKVTKAADRISFALIVSSIIISSSFIIASEAGPKIYDISILGLLGFVGAAFMGIWLLVSILRSGRL
ncbi:ABC1 kinase family protein [Anaerobranca gottschalkii]|uniref:Ubiquinone biosynthesis protein n=1 Tax=Anaerobranca gottschalkii DSM 13577 TaxID=1120990 RepID=A0A1I0ABW8_9FIRM|nr:lipopolysaccharide core heptose(II) kinase RfaY [Anaerobranca gottschalkii]SES91233.1 ubiquinone biosynthesis protein [Anaerobranca gottschalkii DSM 13577]